MITSIIEWAAIPAVVAAFVYAVKRTGWAGSHQPWRACPGCGLPDSEHDEQIGDFERWATEPTVTPGRQS